MAYGQALPTDSASKKFEGVLVDNAGANEFVSKSGSNLRVQNGENIADENVNVTNQINEGVVVDNVGVNEFAAKSGSNRRVQNGDVIADENVNVTNQITGGIREMANMDLNTAASEQTLVVDDTAGGVQFAALHADTTHVMFTARGGEMCFTLRGAAPTSTTGHRMFPHDGIVWRKATAAAAKFIRGYNAPADGKLYLTELIEHRILTGTT